MLCTFPSTTFKFISFATSKITSLHEFLAAIECDFSPLYTSANVDDLLVANKYFSKNSKYAPILNNVITGQLEALLYNPSSITPDNAVAFRALCEMCGDDRLKDKVLTVIADALIEFDKNNFGNKNAEALLKNYEYLQKEALKILLMHT